MKAGLSKQSNHFDDFQVARDRLGDTLVYTPLRPSQTLSSLTGVEIFLKLENLQFTASFKERGALNKLITLSDEEKSHGVIAMSAGNHAQAVARHALRLGVPAVIVMPRTTPFSKIKQTQIYNPEVVLRGKQLSETADYVEERVNKDHLTPIHPFDDLQVIAGQGTLALELLEQCDQQGIKLGTVVVPIGGGGLISGVAQVVKHVLPNTKVIGVQVDTYKGTYERIGNKEITEPSGPTVAEGIAVKSPGEITLPLIHEFVDEIVVVSESEIEDSIFMLLDIEKTLVEGAGAAALAAVRKYPELMSCSTAVLVTGGNMDMFMLETIIQRELYRNEIIVPIELHIQDVPGSLSQLTTTLSELDSNIVEITHRRSFAASRHGSTIVEVLLQVRGRDQQYSILKKLNELGYQAHLMHANETSRSKT